MKHAYCILAHNNWNQLQTLIDLLDDSRNDIYLHIDLKSLRDFNKMGGVKTKYSVLESVNSISVGWGDISICDAEICLYSAVLASNKRYDRVHLISGVDLPLKNQDVIHSFFDLRREEEFIDVKTDSVFAHRMSYYYFFFKESRNSKFYTMVRRLLLVPQYLFVNRLKGSSLSFAYGSNWTSLTLRAIQEIVEKFTVYRHLFKYTSCSDEHFQQMILLSNGTFKFAKENNLRYIDWSQKMSSPKTFVSDDFNSIIQSGCFFARKFNMNEDASIIEKIALHVKNQI